MESGKGGFMTSQPNVPALTISKPTHGSLWSFLVLPSSLAAVFGLAFATIGREAFRYPMLSSAVEDGAAPYLAGSLSVSDPGTVCAVLGLAVLAFLLKSARLRSILLHPLAVLGVSILLSVGVLFTFSTMRTGQLEDLLPLLAILQQFAGYYLIVAWAATLYESVGSKSIILLVLSFALSGAFQALAIGMQEQAVAVMCMLAPFASVLFLQIHRVSVQRQGAALDLPVLVWDRNVLDEGAEREETLSQAVQSMPFNAALLLSSLFCYGAISYVLHASWLPALSAGYGPGVVQALGACGTLAVAVTLLLLFNNEHRVVQLVVFKIALFLMFVIAVFIALFLRNSVFPPLYVALLDSAHKLILFFVWLIPLDMPSRKYAPSIMALLLCAYQAGSVLFRSVVNVPDFQAVVVLFCLVVLAVDLFLSLRHQLSSTQPAVAFADPDGNEVPLKKNQLDAYKQMLFAMFVSDKYALTRRELEVLSLVLRDKTNREIAEQFVVSRETAKTHRRNLLHKIGVSSREELCEVIEELHATEFQEFLSNIASGGEDDSSIVLDVVRADEAGYSETPQDDAEE